MFKKDNLPYGLLLGFLAPILGLVLLKYKKYGALNVKELFQIIYYQPGHAVMTAGLSISLMMNAVLFTLYINNRCDKTGKGLFIATVAYGVVILGIKFLA
jgi:hypothetical protein